MAALLAYGGVRFPAQGSSKISELVQHFETSVSFAQLQDDINDWMEVLASNATPNYASIREVSFHIHHAEVGAIYYAQVHYLLFGDTDITASF